MKFFLPRLFLVLLLFSAFLVFASFKSTKVSAAGCTFTVDPTRIAPHGSFTVNVGSLTPGEEYQVVAGTYRHIWIADGSGSYSTTLSVDQIFGSGSGQAIGGDFVVRVGTTLQQGLPGSEDCSPTEGITVTVDMALAPSATCSLTANPATITQGETSTLSWTTSDAVSGMLQSGTAILNTSVSLPSGSHPVLPTTTTTYTLTVYNIANISATCNATVTVNIPPSPTCTLTATPAILDSGQSSTLGWNAANATSGFLTSNVGILVASVSLPNGSYTASPTSTTTYTLTVRNVANVSGSCNTTVTVNIPPAPTCTLIATPATIDQNQSTVLGWNGTNATAGSLSSSLGVLVASIILPSGSYTVTPTSTSTYILTVRNSINVTGTCSTVVTVNVPSPPPSPPPPSVPPPSPPPPSVPPIIDTGTSLSPSQALVGGCFLDFATTRSFNIKDCFQPARIAGYGNSTGFGALASDVLLILTSVAAALSVIFIVIAGIKFVTAGGDQKKVASASSTLTYAIIGIIVTVLAFVILRVVQFFLGSNIPGV